MIKRAEIAKDTLHKHSKTFSFASFFLCDETVNKVARLYSFCRAVDDIADEGECIGIARKNLNSISKDLELAAEDLRLATRHLGSIVGKVDVEEILGSIFKDFCIGK